MVIHALWQDGPIIEHEHGVFPVGTDSILLADFVQLNKSSRLLDLGTGGGILPILLLSKYKNVTAIAIELDSVACTLANKNFLRNDLSDRVTLLEGDLREHRRLLPHGQMDVTIANPPYFSQYGGPMASNRPGTARCDESCTLLQLCTAAAWSTRWGGHFYLVFRPDRLAELFEALHTSGFAPKRICPVHHTPSAPVNLILLEARRGGNPGLKWEPDLYLYDADGRESADYCRIYHRF